MNNDKEQNAVLTELKLETYHEPCEICGKQTLTGKYKGKEKSFRCGKCRVTIYCSEECQKKHWPEHRLNCEVYTKIRKEMYILRKLIIDSKPLGSMLGERYDNCFKALSPDNARFVIKVDGKTVPYTDEEKKK